MTHYYSRLQMYLAEAFGTGLLVFIGVGSVAQMMLTGHPLSQWEISLIWGAGVCIAICCTAPISGAHLNPAISIALAINNLFDRRLLLPYIAAQMAGAFLAAILVYLFYTPLLVDYELSHHIIRANQQGLATASIFATFPHPAINVVSAFLIEVTITFILMFSILAINPPASKTQPSPLSPLLIGIVIAIIGGSFGTLTGFAMNPARDFAPRLWCYLAGWDAAMSGNQVIPYWLVPFIAPVVGALTAVQVYLKLTYKSYYNKTSQV